MDPVSNQELRRLVSERDAQVVEVLPREEYEQEHVAGALHISLKQLEQDAVGRLDRDRPVVVYCNSFL